MDARGQDLGGGGGAAQPPSRSRDGDAEPAGGAAPPSHAQLVAMIEHAAVAIVAVDVAGRVVTFNRRAVETFGWPGDAIFGRSVDALFATRPPDGAWSHLRDVLGDPATAALASRALRRGRRRDGHEFAAAVTCRRLGDDDAALVMLEVRDRTDELRRADERAAETRWSDETRRWSQALLATARVGIVAHDAAGAISFNHRAEELLGIDLVRRPGEFRDAVRRRDGSPFAPGDGPSHRSPAGEVVAVDLAVAPRDGSRREVVGTSAPVRGSDGRIIGTICTFDDVTDLRRRERRQAFLARAGEVLSASLDPDATAGRVAELAVPVLADACVVEVFDRGRPRVVAHHVAATGGLTALPAGWIGATPWSDAAVRVEGHPTVRGVGDLGGDDDDRRALLARAGVDWVHTLPLVARGQIAGALCLLSTSAHVAEPGLLSTAQAYARIAALALDNAHLHHATEAAIRARDHVLRFVAHDLRSPLNSVALQAQLMRRYGDMPERRAQAPIELILSETSRMHRMIQELLEVGRLAAGEVTLRCSPVAPATVLDEAVVRHRAAAGAGEISLVHETRGDVPAVPVDLDRLRRVLDNLVGNALRFTPAGGEIVLGATRRDGDVLWWVRDSGPGMSAEEAAHVFEPFWQARRRPSSGVGLGLTISRRAVEAHGGRLWVESAAGQGATFFFTTPLTGPAAGGSGA